MPGASSAPRQAAAVIQSAPLQEVTFTGNLSQYAVVDNGNGGFTVTDNLTGTSQTVSAGQRLRFADSAVALDLNGVAGQAYRLYQAAFNRAPDLPGLGFQMNALEGLGRTLAQVGQNFIDSPEFQQTYGNVNNIQFVTLLYHNVLKRDPDPDGLAFHLSYLNGTDPEGRTISRAEDLTGFSESPENKALVLPAIKNGIEYIPYGFNPPSNPPSDYAGTYSGTVGNGDTLTITVGTDGNVQATWSIPAVNANLQGTGTVATGGKLSMTLSGTGGRVATFTGSIRLAASLATGYWQYTAGAGGSGAFHATLPAPPPPPPPTITFARVQQIIMQRCVPCHSAHPTQPGYNPAPLGIMFDTEAQIRARAADIQTYAVQSQFMPYGNITNMPQSERDELAAWFAAGTP